MSDYIFKDEVYRAAPKPGKRYQIWKGHSFEHMWGEGEADSLKWAIREANRIAASGFYARVTDRTK